MKGLFREQRRAELRQRRVLGPGDGHLAGEPPAAEPEPEVRLEKVPSAAVAAQEPTVKMSIYLEPSDDLYLEEIAHTGKTSRPRVAISRSAIVRLALEQLAKAMSTDEIVAELRTRGSQH